MVVILIPIVLMVVGILGVSYPYLHYDSSPTPHGESLLHHRGRCTFPAPSVTFIKVKQTETRNLEKTNVSIFKSSLTPIKVSTFWTLFFLANRLV